MLVIKKNKSVQKWDDRKIVKGLEKASRRSNEKLSSHDIEEILNKVKGSLPVGETVESSYVYSMVVHYLGELNKDSLYDFLSFNKYKDKWADSFSNVSNFANNVLSTGDRENANKDTALNSTKQAVISETTMKELMRAFELEHEWTEAHDEGWIHIHDLGSKFLNGINCCLFDMGNLIKGGFEINGLVYREPSTIQTAFNVVGDATLSASGNQYGGFTIPEIDTVLAPYAEMSYSKWIDYYTEELPNEDISVVQRLAYNRTLREIEKGYIGFETKINTISNSLGQTPFTTITFGMDTSKWARIISKTILKVRMEGIDKDGVTVVFPKLVFLSRKEVNRSEDSPNYDLYLQAIETSKKRMYPDYLSLDGENNNLKDIYEESGKIVSPMGCRAYLGKFYHPETGEMVITGRSNIGAVSLNLPKIAIESKGDENTFFNLIDKYSQMIWDIHDFSFEKIAKSKGSSNPLMFCEGGAWMSVGYDEEIRPIIKASTASLGFVGLNEASEYLFGKPISQTQEFGLKVVGYLKNRWVDEEQGRHEFIPALYSTPAENLVYRFQMMNRDQYGVIKNVTDRDYTTNSFHVHVAEEISPVEKLHKESPYHELATGGRITFAEYPYGVTINTLKHCTDYAMELGLYNGVNIVSSSCSLCLHQGDFLEECPKCFNKDITTVTRACGYLSFSKIKGDTRYNLGKQAEIRERVKHI